MIGLTTMSKMAAGKNPTAAVLPLILWNSKTAEPWIRQRSAYEQVVQGVCKPEVVDLDRWVHVDLPKRLVEVQTRVLLICNTD